MSILINKHTRLLVQGITGNEGLFHTEQMVAYGTNVVAGVTPGKGGEWVLDGKIPVFDSVKVAVRSHRRQYQRHLCAGALCGGCDLRSRRCRHPADRLHHRRRPGAGHDAGAQLPGPERQPPGRAELPRPAHPGEAKVGIIPGNIAIPGNVGVVSRSGTLTYEVLYALKLVGMGVSTCVGIGGDPINGTNFIDCLEHVRSRSTDRESGHDRRNRRHR